MRKRIKRKVRRRIFEPAVNEPIEAAVTAPDVLPVVPPTAAPSPAEPAPAEPAPVSLQTIANAYRDYTRKSFEEIGCYFEQLTSARSLDKAMKVQADFMNGLTRPRCPSRVEFTSSTTGLPSKPSSRFRAWWERGPRRTGNPEFDA